MVSIFTIVLQRRTWSAEDDVKMVLPVVIVTDFCSGRRVIAAGGRAGHDLGTVMRTIGLGDIAWRASAVRGMGRQALATRVLNG